MEIFNNTTNVVRDDLVKTMRIHCCKQLPRFTASQISSSL